MTLATGIKLGPYEILAKLGEGGMGVVYQARDPRLERDVAIKVLPDRYVRDRVALVRFQRETKVVASLSHPNIRSIYDMGTYGNQSFAVMELLNGETLAERLKRESLHWLESVTISLAVAEGLAAAHDKGIIHRDIKPKNIFLTKNGSIKILDFGLAHCQLNETKKNENGDTITLKTQPGSLIGTFPYMSPEQISGRPVDERSDIFSFGCVLYEMITGKNPFQKKGPASILAAILYESPPKIQGSIIGIPETLSQIISDCLEKDPNKRFQSAQEIIAKLKLVEKNNFSQINKISGASVAVLPFVNMSPDQKNDYFGDGLAEELINSLFKIEGLHVASRTSSFTYKGKNQDIRHIGNQLNVSTVLEGSVRRSENRLRVTAQLIDTSNGYHLWSDIFDREIEDVFNIQFEISENIAQALRVVLSNQERRALQHFPTRNIEAYDCSLRGRQYFYQFTQAGFEQARKLYAQALNLDPNYATAYAWASYCYSFIYSWFNASETNLNKADKTSLKALQLGPELAESHVARGMALTLQNKLLEAREEFEFALHQNPGLYDAYYFYARVCFTQGELEKAAELAEKSNGLHPYDCNTPCLLGMIYKSLGNEEKHQESLRRGLDAIEKQMKIFPDDARILYLGGAVSIRLGKNKQGLKWAERALEANPVEPMTLYGIACSFSLIGHLDRAFECLEKAAQYGRLPREWIEKDPDLDSLREHPRYNTLLKNL
ncbi:MAG: FlgO family outer membrane protein [Candidatus Aminicenantes bacterium]|nr:FlgO family outer membrane protein [Candidatus Aminicenantes bacterium]